MHFEEMNYEGKENKEENKNENEEQNSINSLYYK